MISPSDKEYTLTKAIKLGLDKLNSPFIDLANWIFNEFGVKPLNIMYDTLEHNTRPRLQIIFERYDDKKAFQKCKSPDTFKQLLANKFRSLIINDMRYSPDNLLIICDYFEKTARYEANLKISVDRLERLRQDLNNNEIWTIQRNFSTGIFFFFTDEQLKQNSKQNYRSQLVSKYFSLIKEHDIFDYIKEEDFSVILDSKENFDKNYQSNWFYYYKNN
jgi:hypothetical protein